MEKFKIYIIEDNRDTRKFLETVLSKDFEVHSSENAMTGIERIKKHPPDLIIMDVLLPNVDGFEACSIIKNDEKLKSIPIIFLSAKNSAGDIAQGLDLGAEDYLGKPFDYKELVARIKARLREKSNWKSQHKVLHSGDIRLNIDTRDVTFHNRHIELTQTEFDLLKFFIQHNGKIVTRESIIESIWKDDKSSSQKRTIDVHIRSLRKKIASLTRDIRSVYGKGYKYQH